MSAFTSATPGPKKDCQATQRITLETSGYKRTLYGKIFGDEFRVYRIEGDVTQDLGEVAQELAIDLSVSRVSYRI